MRLLLSILTIILFGQMASANAQSTDPDASAVLIIGVGTAHPSGVSSLFSNVPVIEMLWAPIDIRRVEVDRTTPSLVVRREYCNPLALARASCPARDQQIQYNAYEVPAGVYVLRSITVSDSDLIRGDTATTDYFYPPGHLIFHNTLPAALEMADVPKLLLAPGGVYYAGNFIIDYDGKAPQIDRISRDDKAAAEVMKEQTGSDVPLIHLDPSRSSLKGIES
ncbi:hypothetical protein [Minwuia sp.]|uniref:hypothetical protein n=1 Tax=Minwuia sp. TaxID=2493630 RepID=UPI003A8C981F